MGKPELSACRCLFEMLRVDLPGVRAYCSRHRLFGLKLEDGGVLAARTAAGLLAADAPQP